MTSQRIISKLTSSCSFQEPPLTVKCTCQRQKFDRTDGFVMTAASIALHVPHASQTAALLNKLKARKIDAQQNNSEKDRCTGNDHMGSAGASMVMVAHFLNAVTSSCVQKNSAKISDAAMHALTSLAPLDYSFRNCADSCKRQTTFTELCLKINACF